MQLDYTILDVFAERALEGNPLAVFHDGSDLSTEQMQALARETNLSETTFVIRSGPEACAADDDAVRVRIFTTQEELPFAGHPTLGTATWLWLHDERLRGRETITLALNVGRIPVRFEGDSTPAKARAVMQPKDPSIGPALDAATVAPLLSLEAGDLLEGHAPRVVSSGLPFCVVALRSLEALSKLSVRHDLATPWLRSCGATFFFVLTAAGDGDPLHWRARMQFYGAEDPATGSAAGCAISYLVTEGLVPSGALVTLHQGIEIQRPSELRVSAVLDGAGVCDVRVGGSTIPVASGRFFLP